MIPPTLYMTDMQVDETGRPTCRLYDHPIVANDVVEITLEDLEPRWGSVKFPVRLTSYNGKTRGFGIGHLEITHNHQVLLNYDYLTSSAGKKFRQYNFGSFADFIHHHFTTDDARWYIDLSDDETE